MELTIFGRQNKAYIIQVKEWAKRLEADECIIHEDHTVTLSCKYGGICTNYRPSAKELTNKN